MRAQVAQLGVVVVLVPLFRCRPSRHSRRRSTTTTFVLAWQTGSVALLCPSNSFVCRGRIVMYGSKFKLAKILLTTSVVKTWSDHVSRPCSVRFRRLP